jgi:hypothetical protein
MYNNVLLLLDALKKNKYILYTDYNINEYHLNEFYSNHKNQLDIKYIKLYMASRNKNTDINSFFNEFETLNINP